MKMIGEIQSSFEMEIRPNSSVEYLEAVIEREDLELLKSLLMKHLGPAAKEPGKEVVLPMKIQRLADSMGGLRVDQSGEGGVKERQVADGNYDTWSIDI